MPSQIITKIREHPKQIALTGVILVAISLGGIGVIEPSDPTDLTNTDDRVTYVHPSEGHLVKIYVQTNYVCTYETTSPDSPRSCEVNAQEAYNHLSYTGFYTQHPEFSPPANATTTSE